MPGKYINPYTDFGFKRIFGQEANKDVLISFLNSLLPQRHQIADLRFINTEQVPSRQELYSPILDVSCVSPSGERFIVEMQRKRQELFVDRSVYYTACAIRDQVKRGQECYNLAAVYFVGIMDFVHALDGVAPELVHEVSLKDRHGVEFYDKLRMYFVQMPLFAKSEGELETPLDKWLFFLKNLPGLDQIPAVLNEPSFMRAFETAEFSAMSEAEQSAYHKAWDNLIVNRDIYDTAMKEGHAEGLAEGLAEGEAKGRAEGLAEANRDVARRMKALGMPAEQIAGITGLTAGQIAGL